MSGFDVFNLEDIFDSRDVIKRINELKEEWAEVTEEESADDYALSEDDWSVGLGEDGAAEIVALLELAARPESELSGWDYGVTFIADHYFIEYAKELAEDIGAIDREASWPAYHIDWEAAAEDLKMDYSQYEFNGEIYWAR